MHRLIINLKQCPACNGTNQEIYPNGYVSCDCGFLAKSVDVWNARSDTDFLTRLRKVGQGKYIAPCGWGVLLDIQDNLNEQISAKDTVIEQDLIIIERLEQQNAELVEMCDRFAEWLENVHIDYSNGNVAPNGMDEGDVLGWKGHKEMIEAYTALMKQVKD